MPTLVTKSPAEGVNPYDGAVAIREDAFGHERNLAIYRPAIGYAELEATCLMAKQQGT